MAPVLFLFKTSTCSASKALRTALRYAWPSVHPAALLSPRPLPCQRCTKPHHRLFGGDAGIKAVSIVIYDDASGRGPPGSADPAKPVQELRG